MKWPYSPILLIALSSAWVAANLNDADLAWLRSQPGFADRLKKAGECYEVE